MSWYYSKNGTQLGPVAEEELSAKAKSGEVLASDLVWKEGMADWKPMGQVSEFSASSAPVFVPPAVPTATGGNVPMPQPAAGLPGYPSQQTIPTYMAASITATVIGGLLCALVSLPLGIVALVYSTKVENLQLRGDLAGAMSASKAAKTWMICSFAATGLMLAFMVVVFLFAAFGPQA